MIDQQIRRILDPYLTKCVSVIADTKIQPNHLTVIGFLAGAIGCFFLLCQCYLWALGFLAINRLFDALDGSLARYRDAQKISQTGVTDFGGYFDIVSDFIFYNGFVFFFAAGAPQLLLPAAFLMFSFVGTGTSFLAFAIFEAKHGLAEKAVKPKGAMQKSFFYIGGLTEGTETILCFSLMCIFPQYFAVLAYGFAGLCWVTTGTRIYQAYRLLK